MHSGPHIADCTERTTQIKPLAVYPEIRLHSAYHTDQTVQNIRLKDSQYTVSMITVPNRNLPYDNCSKQGLKSACTSAQSDQILH